MNLRSMIYICLIIVMTTSQEDTYGKHSYSLKHNQTKSLSIIIQKAIRISLMQQLGQSRFSISDNQQIITITSQIIYEKIISQQNIGKTLLISLQGQSIISKGVITIQTYSKYQLLNIEEENIVHLNKNQQRMLQIHPRKKLQMMIERFDGIPSFIVNRCQLYEKKGCHDEMHRFIPQEMKKHIESLVLEECSNCLVLIKLSTKSDYLNIRISFTKTKTIFPQYPNMILIKKQQLFQIKTYKQQNKKGRILLYSGRIEILSDQNITFTNFTNGYFFQLSNIKEESNTSNDTINFSIKGLKQLSYLIIQYPISESNITLIDGFMSTIYVQSDQQYIINYENHHRGKANVVLSSTSQLLSRVSLKFTSQQNQKNYLIRPKLIFNQSTASQNFQLDQSNGKIIIYLHLTSGQSGFVNISAQVHELITIPLDYKYTSIIYYQEYDEYIIQGVTGNVQVNIQKCVECSVKYSISEQYIESTAVKQLKQFSISQTFKIHKNELYIRVQTGNYAFYSLSVTKSSGKNHIGASNPQTQVKFYLTDDHQDNLLLQFYPPLCNQQMCQNITYYLMESSNLKHLSSKLYCPSQLFDFDQNIKDLIIQVIKPQKIGQLMSYTRPIKHRDFIGIAALVDDKLLPYQVINIQEMKNYKDIKWPLFFMTVFIFLALFCSFIIFMVLRKGGHQNNRKGYKKISSDTYKYDQPFQ